MEVRVKVIAPDFSKFEERVKNPEQMLRDIQKLRRISFYNSIANEKDATGKKVKPLTEAYAIRKRAKYGNRNIRVASGKLISRYKSDINGNKLEETIDDDIAIYVDKDRQLLPRNWDDIPLHERKLINQAATSFLEDVIDDLVRITRR